MYSLVIVEIRSINLGHGLSVGTITTWTLSGVTVLLKCYLDPESSDVLCDSLLDIN